MEVRKAREGVMQGLGRSETRGELLQIGPWHPGALALGPGRRAAAASEWRCTTQGGRSTGQQGRGDEGSASNSCKSPSLGMLATDLALSLDKGCDLGSSGSAGHSGIRLK